jgi:hypothetical protein
MHVVPPWERSIEAKVLTPNWDQSLDHLVVYQPAAVIGKALAPTPLLQE